ncbi:MAG: TatD family hydrolase [Alphaproteobacteria bacterium]|nr:TatD family hydrolase [Alphaproteobacteria bacterium]MBU0887870.1 TatD family hydrolase [Alphaproteobacteria bacterium]MBU1814907.1 TatD family hydrolase [Alphaproteobacteria bacterium]
MLVDSHCHLDFPDFAEELDAVVERARAAGVARMVTICTKITEFGRVRGIAERYDDIYCTVGIHPHEADSQPETDAARLIAEAQHPKVVGIGESGLDYFYEHSGREAQQRSFRAHIKAARETGLPLVVHTRDADDDTVAILREEHGEGAFPGLIHCFSSSRELAEKSIELGLYISLSGIVTFKKAVDLQETVRALPLDRLLLETDSPYLAPIPHRGRRNEPAFVAHTAKMVAELKGLSMAEVEKATTENFARLFKKVEMPSAQAA